MDGGGGSGGGVGGFGGGGGGSGSVRGREKAVFQEKVEGKIGRPIFPSPFPFLHHMFVAILFTPRFQE